MSRTIRGELHSQTIGAKQSSHIGIYRTRNQEIRYTVIGKYHKRDVPRAIRNLAYTLFNWFSLPVYVLKTPWICPIIEVQRYTRGTRILVHQCERRLLRKDEATSNKMAHWLNNSFIHRAFLDWQKWTPTGKVFAIWTLCERTSFAKIRMLKEMMNLRRICPCMKAEMSG